MTQTGAPASYPAKSPKLTGWLDVRPGLQVSERGVASGLGTMLKADGNSRYSFELLQFKAQPGPGYTPSWAVCTNSFVCCIHLLMGWKRGAGGVRGGKSTGLCHHGWCHYCISLYIPIPWTCLCVAVNTVGGCVKLCLIAGLCVHRCMYGCQGFVKNNWVTMRMASFRPSPDQM